MADVSLINDESMEDPDEGFEQGDSNYPGYGSSYRPLMRIQNYAESSMFTRHKLPKAVLDEFRKCPPEILIEDLPDIMKILTEAADESILRSELFEQIPHIAAQAVECSTRVSAFKDVVGDYLIPLLVRNLGCIEITSTLIQLIKQGFISKLQVEIQVCPTILALTKAETAVDVHMTAINLMSRLAPLLGRDVTERVFLGRFTELCSNTKSHIRKACAAHFGHFCAIVSKDSVEKILLPEYLTLCLDEIWSVRKSCADVVTCVSCACNANSRTSKLAPAFSALLQDDCRWVRVSAFQSLGHFISTFANPPITEMEHNANGDLLLVDGLGGVFFVPPFTLSERLALVNAESAEKKFEDYLFNRIYDEDDEENSGNSENSDKTNKTQEEKKENVKESDDDSIDANKDIAEEVKVKEKEEESKVVISTDCDNSEIIVKDESNCVNREKATHRNSDNNNIIEKIEEKDVDVNDVNDDDIISRLKEEEIDKKVIINNNDNTLLLEDDLHLFYSHNYWYISPEMPLDPNIILIGEDSTNMLVDGAGDAQDPSQDASITHIAAGGDNNNSTISLEEKAAETTEDDRPPTQPEQTIVPQILVDRFISMTYPMLSMNVEHEMAYYCAHSLPAVVRTLGRSNWHLLEDTVFSLAGNMQYKVRRTVASSLHALAIILGPEIATNSLSQLFEGFLKDLDEVRIGILSHLSSFLKTIEPSKRNTYLPRLAEFLQTDNEWNWRFREELAKQLFESMDLFKPKHVAKHLFTISLDLLSDKVAAVRQAALTSVVKLISYTSSESNITSNLLMKLAENFAHSKKWKRRQTFCLLCIDLLKEEALDPEIFASEVMPHLLDLSWDPVANIRLVVARCISKYIITDENFMDTSGEQYEGIETVLRRLQADKDCDVSQSAEI